MTELKLTDLINLEALQRIQDGFSKYTGMAAVTIDVNGTPITMDSGFTRFCNEMTRKSELGCKNCEQCDRDGAYKTLENGKASAYVCHAGLMDFAAPIMVEGEVIGGIIGGQVRINDIDEVEIRKKAIEYGIDPDEYVLASKETSLLSREAVEKAAGFIEEIGSALSLMAYKSYMELKESERQGRVAQSQAAYVMNMSMNLDHIMERWFRMVDSTATKMTSEDVFTLLSDLQDDGREIKNSLRDTISFIKMSADDVEVSESEYTLEQLIEVIEQAAKGKASVEIVSAEYTRLFGDLVRIGQMITQTIKDITERNSDGNLEVLVSTKRKQYATYLKIVIIDRDTKYTHEDIEKIKTFFKERELTELDSRNELDMWLSLEGMLLRNMSGTVAINKLENDFIMEISLPQIGL